MLQRLREIMLLLAALALASCGVQPEIEKMPDGAILYSPRPDTNIRLLYSNAIVDKLTGYHLYGKGTRSLPEFDKSTLTLWQLDRSSAGLPDVYFLTKPFETDGNWLSRRSGLEIVHAHADGFFPFRDALDPRELSFSRIASMLDRFGEKDRPRGQVYLDNRLAFREQRQIAQSFRDKLPFVRANFNLDPRADNLAEVLLPTQDLPGSAEHMRRKLASSLGTLKVTLGIWSPFLDRSGRPVEFRAEWSDQRGLNPFVVRMSCFRSYREGYGETRAVEIISLGRPTFRGSPIEIAFPGPPPTWAELAELINVSEPIAGPRAGHMVVAVSKEAARMASGS